MKIDFRLVGCVIVAAVLMVAVAGCGGGDNSTALATADAMVNPFTMNGTISHVRIVDGEVTQAYSNGSLTCLDLALTLPPVQEAHLTAVERFDGHGAFLIDADWAQGGPPRGTVIILDHGNGYTHGYRVESIEATDTGSRINLADEPGFEFDAATDTATFTFAHHWAFIGDHIVKWNPAAGYHRVDGE